MKHARENMIFVLLVITACMFIACGDPLPQTPNTFTVKAVSNSTIIGMWNGYYSAGEQWEVYRDSALWHVAINPAFIDNGLIANTTYCYYIVAFSGTYRATPSEIKCATTWKITNSITNGISNGISNTAS